MPTLPQQRMKHSWADRYRPERLFYLLLISVLLSVPINLLLSFIAQGPESVTPSQLTQLYIFHLALVYPILAVVIGLLAIILALYGFRLNQRHKKTMAEKEKQGRLKETESQILPVHDVVQGVASQQQKQGEGLQQILEQTTQIQHIVTQNTVSLISVHEIKPATLNLGDDQSATFPYLTTVFPKVYEQARQIFRTAIADAHQRGLLVTGAPMAGKTRLAYEVMLADAADWLVLTWTRGLNAVAIPVSEVLANQRIILFLDDLQQYAESERSGDELTGTSNDFPLDRLYVTLMQSAAQVVIVATCRATDLSRAETTAALRWLFEKIQVVEIPFIPDEQQHSLIEILKATNATIDYHTGDFDSTIGSLLLGLSRKREQYLELKAQRNPGYLALRAMKLLNIAGISMQTGERVRAMTIQALGGRILNDDFMWSMICEELEERQFVTQVDGSLIIRKDVYFDKVITDYPTSVHDALLNARRVFQAECDGDALIALTWVHSERKEYSEMLDTSSKAVELAQGNARAHYVQGIALSYMKRDEEALLAFDMAVSLDARFAIAWNNKGFMLDNLGRYDEAVEAYEQAIALNHQYASAWYNKAIALDKLRRYDEALTAYNEAIQWNPLYADAWYNKGIVLSKLKQKVEAATAFDEALKVVTHDPTFATGWYNKGDMLFALKRYDEAVTAYDRALTLNPYFADARYNKGLALWNLQRYEEYLAVYDEVVKLNPQDAEAWCNKGRGLWNLQHYEDALVHFEQALALNPHYSDAWMDKGWLLYDLKRYEEAAACYDKAVIIDARNAVAWSSKGVALSWLDRHEEAIACYNKAIALEQQYAIAWNNKGFSLSELKCYEEALEAFDTAILYDSRSPNPFSWKGMTLRELHRDEEALICFEQALAIDAKHKLAWYRKGSILRRLGRYEEALVAYKKAIKYDTTQRPEPQDIEFYEEALAAFDAAIKLNPEDADTWDDKGMLLFKLGKLYEARANFDEAIRLEPRYAEYCEKAMEAFDTVKKTKPRDYQIWENIGMLLWRARKEDEAHVAFDEARRLNPISTYTQNSPPSFGRYVSPDLVDDQYLDTEIVMLFNGLNMLGEPVYTYVKMTGSSLKELFAKMQAGENFKPADYGTVLASGMGFPSEELREEMKKAYDLIDVPTSRVSISEVEPKPQDSVPESQMNFWEPIPDMHPKFLDNESR